jgi:putative membrane protein
MLRSNGERDHIRSPSVGAAVQMDIPSDGHHGGGVTLGRLALVLGIGAMIALVVVEGAGSIVALLSHAGWILLLLVPMQLLPMLLDVLGWRVLIAAPLRLAPLYLIACIRQAINRLLPVANVGGEIVGVRLLSQRGLSVTTAAASVVVELMLGLIAQYLFVAVGAVCWVARGGNARIAHGLMVGLAVSLPLLALMVVVARHGQIFERVERLARRFLGGWLPEDALADKGSRLDEDILATFAGHGRVGRSLAWQLSAFLVGSAEVWFALRWLGHPVGVPDALVLESLMQAAKSVFFVVPAGLGVQEAGLIGAGLLVGVSPEAALALSLAKRMREIVFGVPALVAWQWLEGRNLVAEGRRRDELRRRGALDSSRHGK